MYVSKLYCIENPLCKPNSTAISCASRIARLAFRNNTCCLNDCGTFAIYLLFSTCLIFSLFSQVSYKNAKSSLKQRDLLNLLTKYIPKIPPREISCETSFRVRCDQREAGGRVITVTTHAKS